MLRMSTQSESPTKRVELKDGHWAELRMTAKVRDSAEKQIARHERGDFDDHFLDAIVEMRTKMVAWSLGDVDDAAVMNAQILDLDDDDFVLIFNAMRGRSESPKASSSSPSGTRRTKVKSAEKNPGNGS